ESTMRGPERLTGYLGSMGNAPFEPPAPDGYPDSAEPWLGTLLWRWNFAAALGANKIESAGVSLDRLVAPVGGPGPSRPLPRFIGRARRADEVPAPEGFNGASGGDNGGTADLVGLILASPLFKCTEPKGNKW